MWVGEQVSARGVLNKKSCCKTGRLTLEGGSVLSQGLGCLGVYGGGNFLL